MRRTLTIATLVLAITFLADTKTQAAFGETRTYISQLYAGDGGLATDAFFDFPEDLYLTSDGTIWIADTFDNVIRVIRPTGIVETFAGTGAYGLVNGSAATARFGFPQGIAVDGDTVYVSDTDNSVVRKIDLNGSVSTLLSTLSSPQGLALHDTTLYIADTGNNAIKKYALSSGTVSTLTTAIKAPRKIALSPDGQTLYAVDNGNYRVVRINTATGEVTVIAGDGTKGYKEGTGTAAQFYDPAGIGLDAANNTLYVGDIDSDRIAMIRKIDLTTNTTTRWVYDSAMTSVNERSSMRVHNGYLYLAGTGNVHRYKLSDPAQNNDVGGKDRYQLREGAISQALLARPGRMIFSKDRQWMYIVGAHKILKLNRTTGQLIYVIGTSVDNYVEGKTTTARFSGVSGLAVNAANDTLYVTDRFNNRIRKVDLATQTSTHLSGIGDINTTGPGNGYAEGAADQSRFANPVDVVLTPDEKTLIVSDTGNHRIRKVDVATGATSLLAGSSAGFKDGLGAEAKFSSPFGLALDSTGTLLFVADRNNHAIRQVRVKDGAVTTLAGTGKAGYLDAVGTKAVLNLPTALALDGDRLFFSDSGSHRIRVLELGSRVVKLVAGDGRRGFKNGDRTAAEFNNLGGLLVDSVAEVLYVGDVWNDLIRKIDIAGDAPFTDARPIVAKVAPTMVRNVGGTAQIDVRGSGFRHGISVSFGGVSVKSFVESAGKLAVKVPISTMTNGWYDVRVTNVDGQSDTLESGFALADRTDTVPTVYHTLPSEQGFAAFPATVRGGVETAAADIDGDGTQEIVAVAGSGNPVVRILHSNGTLVRQFRSFPATVRDGLTLSVGDVTGDGNPDILVAPRTGTFELRLYSVTGKLLSRFLPLGRGKTTDASLAVGDVTGDGVQDILVASGSGEVSVWSAAGKKLRSFKPYGRTKNGVRLAVADVDGDGTAEIITVSLRGNVQLKVFTGAGTLLRQTTAFPKSVKTGASVAAGDLNGDALPEIIVGLRPGNRPYVRIFSSALVLQKQFLAFSSRYRGGVGVAFGAVSDDGVGKIIASALQGNPDVVVFNQSGRAVR